MDRNTDGSADGTTWLSEADLIACAAQQELHEPNDVVTPRKLKRWRNNDLIPRPRRRSLGRGRGFRVEYPPGTCEQLLVLLRLHRTERRLHHVRLSLWLQGFPIPFAAIKKTLDVLTFRPIHRIREDLRHTTVEDAAALSMPTIPRLKTGRTIRRRLHDDAAVQQLLTHMMRLILEIGPVFERRRIPNLTTGEDGVANLLIRAMGLEVARSESVGEAGPWLTGDPAETLERLERQGAFSFDHMQQTLHVASTDMLEQARVDAGIFFPGLASIAQALHITAAPEVFGWFFRLLDTHDPEVQVMTIVYLLAARQELGGTPIDTINATLAAQRPAMEITLGILAAAPDLAPYLNPKTGLQALTTLTARNPAASDAVTQQLVALFNLHPEWTATMEMTSETTMARTTSDTSQESEAPESSQPSDIADRDA